ncbi:MAG: glycoside hydrolase family 57 protein [Nitrospirota bacterium]
MKTVHLCFLWHMHQPYYTDPVAGCASMPWVRLHATKAYFDMACLIERFPGIKATFNFTPSLVTQLQELAAGSVRDLFLEHAQKPAADLTAAERAFVVRHFFAANWATMVRPSPRYHELLVKRGMDIHGQDLDALARQFTAQELLDLQVWQNLAWFGYGALARHPDLAALRRKDRWFTEEDKQTVLAIQRHTVGEILPLYRRLAEAGQVELTTTPFYHPILPLLIDTDFARRARPDLPLPQRFQAPADAQAQVRKAVALHERTFGTAPAGLWPSEGSVCPEMVPILKEAGLRWTATDEGVLARSLSGWSRQTDLYQPYRIGPEGEDLTIIFRDRDLSDAFSFVYAKATPESAVEDVLGRIGEIARQAPADRLLLPVILDGENPWEHYYDSGERFLSGLYGALTSDPVNGVRVAVESVSGALAHFEAPQRLVHLHSGSWINADYKIWIGHQEDNRGWELIRETRARLAEASGRLPEDQIRAAWEELYAAEGSDWFWWYGDDFQTDYKTEFDRLFRLHLRNALARADLPVPDFLNEPLIGEPEPYSVHLPVNLISPTVDGLVSDFFEWQGAGSIDPAPPLGAMWRASRIFTYIGFGFSLDALFLRLDPGEAAAPDQPARVVEVHVETNARLHKLTFPLTGPSPDHTFTLWSASRETGAASFVEIGRYGTIGWRKVIELAVPFKDLHLEAGQEFRMSLAVTEGGLEIDRYPRHLPLVLTVPDRDYEATLWRV